jgi:hypothetical protein
MNLNEKHIIVSKNTRTEECCFLVKLFEHGTGYGGFFSFTETDEDILTFNTYTAAQSIIKKLYKYHDDKGTIFFIKTIDYFPAERKI